MLNVLIQLINTPHILEKVQGQIKEVCRLIEPCLLIGTREYVAFSSVVLYEQSTFHLAFICPHGLWISKQISLKRNWDDCTWRTRKTWKNKWQMITQYHKSFFISSFNFNTFCALIVMHSASRHLWGCSKKISANLCVRV